MFGTLNRFFRGASTAVVRPATAPIAQPSRELASAPVHVFRDEGLVHLADGHLAFSADSVPTERIRLGEICQLSLFGAAGVTSPCLRELMRRGIPVVWRSSGGHYVGQSVDLSGQSAAVRRAQYRAADNPQRSLEIARVLIHAKIINARGLVRRSTANSPNTLLTLQNLAAKTKRADLQSLLGVEGAAAAVFYAAIPDMIVDGHRADFAWSGRRRRPPTDELNALLSYLYAVVAGECGSAALAASLDPSVGFIHAERPGRPALALDLLEPFRPLIADSVALSAINRGEVRKEHFDRSEASVRLNDHGRRAVIAALERRFADVVPVRTARETTMTWREAIAAHAKTLASALKAGGEFASFERG